MLDSGIDASHPHFKYHENLNLKPPLVHTDFTQLGAGNLDDATAQRDAFGHGTHVAGIIAGALRLTAEYKKNGGEEDSRKLQTV